jgi:flagellar biosynthetic protein FliO
MNGFLSVLMKILYFVIVFGIIILLAYFSTKVIGKRVSGNSGKYMRIVDTLFMGADRTLLIVKVKDEYLLMSSSGRGIETVKELDGFKEEPAGTGSGFEEYLNNYSGWKLSKGGFPGFFRKRRSGGDDTYDE